MEEILIDGKYRPLEDWFMYDDKVIELMYDVKFYGMPVSFLLLDQRKTDTYCHFCASLLNVVIPDSVRVKGKKKVLGGGEHSWVETDDYVYDTSTLSKWKKDSYYDRDNPYDVEWISFTDVLENTLDQRTRRGTPELYTVWIRDLEEELARDEFHPYGRQLKDHIARFSKEEGLGEKQLDEDLVLKCYNELQEFYREIADFKKANKVKEKK